MEAGNCDMNGNDLDVQEVVCGSEIVVTMNQLLAFAPTLL